MAAAAALLLCTTAAEAQRGPGVSLPGTATRQVDGAVFIGAVQLDVGALNARVAQFGYPAVESSFPQFGLVWATTRQNVRLGVEFAGAARPADVRADGRYRTQVSAAHAMFNVGYEIFREGGVSVHPKVGIGGGGVNVTVSDRNPATFDQVLQQPGRHSNLTIGSLLVDGSLGVSYRLRPDIVARGGRSLMLGVRAGYTTSVLHGGWAETATDAPGGPTAGWGGPHVSFMIGRSTAR